MVRRSLIWFFLGISLASTVVEAYVPGTLITNSTVNMIEISFMFGGTGTTGSPTVCGTGTCVIYNQSGTTSNGVSSITNTGSTYEINFPSGVFSSPPNCFFITGGVSAFVNPVFAGSTGPTATKFVLYTGNTSGVFTNAYASGQCIGRH